MNSARKWLLLLSTALCVPLHAAVHLPAVFSDHMVIQRNEPVRVWGDADAGESVAVGFRGMQRNTVADSLGRWSIEFPGGAAGGPFTLSIRASNVITIRDVLVGDVWIASGQSNMSFELREAENSEPAIAQANLSQVRLLTVNQRFADYPQEDLSLTMAWSVCTPASAANFSAVAYFFAREISILEKVPIGIVDDAWGGTPAEAWTSMDALSRDPSLMPVFSAWAAMADAESETLRKEEKEEKEIQAANAAGKNQSLPWHPVFNAWAPAALYNGMIAPLTRFPIRGVIWYQGESNTGPLRYILYARLFPALIQDWRSAWSEGNFPFLFVQIANLRVANGDDWPAVREAQRQALSLVNTAMVVTIDIGDPDSIHPRDKQDVGDRLALAARAIAYKEPVEYSGPLYREMSRDGQRLRLYFDHADGGLIVKSGSLQGFEIAGADGKFFPATAAIEGETVVLTNANVPEPVQARYGWSDNPPASLFNRAGLPASPFRTAHP
jgi:sialate O-acetylesterase